LKLFCTAIHEGPKISRSIRRRARTDRRRALLALHRTSIMPVVLLPNGLETWDMVKGA